MIKKFIYSILLLIGVVLFVYLVGVYLNNRDLPRPGAEIIQQRLERSIQWLVNNEADLLQQANPMLWWMLQESENISHDGRISGLLSKYKQRYPRIRASAWGPLFGEPSRSYLAGYSVNGLPYYNQHFIYALNCAADIAEDILVVEQQNKANFCHQPGYIYRPACITHQLMGINFLAIKNCGLLSNIDEVMASLQSDIKWQLTFDIRVVDVYLQRVLMLLITGAEEEVKPVWIQQVIDHQLDDGGWGGFVSLLPVSSERSLGFSPRIVSIGKEKSDFHATAQGVLILNSLLKNETKK
jgi:hypothetical protein